MAMNGNLRGKRKFTVAMSALLLSALALFVGRIAGSEWVTVTGLIVGLYGGAAAMTAAVTRNNGPDTNS